MILRFLLLAAPVLGVLNGTSTYHPPSATQDAFSGRAPECSSKSLSWEKAFQTVTTSGTYANPWEDSTYWSAVIPWPTTEMITFTTNDHSTTNPYSCCGQCRINWLDVTVSYWPVPEAETDCTTLIDQQGSQLGPAVGSVISHIRTLSQALTLPTPLQRRAPVSNGGAEIELPPVTVPNSLHEKRDNSPGSSAILNGTNQTSATDDYIYIDIPLITAYDNCGGIGSAYTNVQASFLSKDIYSVMPKNIGCYGAFLDQKLDLLMTACSISTEPFNFTQLPCPPSSLRSWGQSSFIYDVHYPYNPIIGGNAISSFIQNLDPAWASCIPEYGWDPYSILTEFPSLLTPTSDHHVSQDPSPAPQPTQPATQTSFVDPDPKTTVKPADPPQASTPKATATPAPADPSSNNNGDPQDPEPTPNPPASSPKAQSSPSDTPAPQTTPAPVTIPLPTSTGSPDPDLVLTTLGHTISIASQPSAKDPAEPQDPHTTATVVVDGSTLTHGHAATFSDGAVASVEGSNNVVLHPAPSEAGNADTIGQGSEPGAKATSGEKAAPGGQETPSAQVTSGAEDTSSAGETPNPTPLTTLGHTIAAAAGDSGGIVVDGHTVRSGEAFTAGDGTPISAIVGGEVAIGSRTVPLSAIVTPTAGSGSGDEGSGGGGEGGVGAVQGGGGGDGDGNGNGAEGLPTGSGSDSIPTAALTTLGHAISARPNGGYVIDGHTMTSDEVYTDAAGTPISILSSGGIAIGSSTVAVSGLSSAPQITSVAPGPEVIGLGAGGSGSGSASASSVGEARIGDMVWSGLGKGASSETGSETGSEMDPGVAANTYTVGTGLGMSAIGTSTETRRDGASSTQVPSDTPSETLSGPSAKETGNTGQRSIPSMGGWRKGILVLFYLYVVI